MTYLRKIMPIRDIVAGEAQLRSWVSKMKLTFEPNWILSPLGIVSNLLSSKTEFKDSIHSGSISPSQIIQEVISISRHKNKIINPKKNTWKISPLAILTLFLHYNLNLYQDILNRPSAIYFCFLITKFAKYISVLLTRIVTRSFSYFMLPTNNNKTGKCDWK